MLWFFHIQVTEAAKLTVYQHKSVKRKSMEDQTWKGRPTLFLTFHWLELSHMPHLIPRAVRKWSESVSPGKKGTHLLLAGHDFVIVAAWEWVNVCLCLYVLHIWMHRKVSVYGCWAAKGQDFWSLVQLHDYFPLSRNCPSNLR